MPNDLPPPADRDGNAMSTELDDSNHDLLLDGIDWDHHRVLAEVLHYTDQLMRSGYEIGRRLTWTKAVLGHGRFQQWCEANLPFSQICGRKYMQVAAFLDKHPGMRKPAQALGLKKTLLLATLAPDQIEQILDEGRLAEADIEGLDEVPYSVLKKEVAKLHKAVGESDAKLSSTDAALTKAKLRIAELAGEVTVDDQVAIDRIADLHEQLDLLFSKIYVATHEITANLSERHVQVKAHLLGFHQYSLIRAEYSETQVRMQCGDIFGGSAVLNELETRPRELSKVFEFPAAQLSPRWDDGSTDAKGRNKR